MNGMIMVTYKILCNADLNKEINIKELLLNEKVAKVIKSEFAKGFRNINLLSSDSNSTFKIETIKEFHTFEVSKNDFADILVLAEEDATAKKLIKKDCDRVELINIETIS
ncbi:MAG: hypothetical protein U9P72_01145 [Campylobacterota bacterium]|nr:hypothetical protein [Campylobacterota bacterium]